MSPFEAILLGVLAPALVAGAALLPCLRRPALGGLAALAVAAGYVAGHLAIAGAPKRFPPLEARDWLPWLAVAAALLGWLAARFRPARGPLVILAGAALPWTLLQSYVEYQWTGLGAALRLGTIGLVLILCGASWLHLVERRPGALVPLSLTVTGTFTAISIALSGSALIGQLGGVVTATFGALLVATWLRPELSAAAAVLPALVLLATLWITGAYYAELPRSAALLLALAPSIAWLREWPPIARRSPRVATLLAAGAVLLPAVAAAGVALAHFEPAPQYDY